MVTESKSGKIDSVTTMSVMCCYEKYRIIILQLLVYALPAVFFCRLRGREYTSRLRVRPFCRLTVKCQEEYEKKYGSYANYRAKNSDHVGFGGLQNDIENAISLDDSEE